MNRISPIRAWFDAIPDALLLVDDRGTIVYANSRCEGILEWPPDELEGQQVEVLLPPRLRITLPFVSGMLLRRTTGTWEQDWP